jgi:30S ribosomal protein S31
MGKGDKKTKKGKISMGSYGKLRPKDKVKSTIIVEKKADATPKKEVESKKETVTKKPVKAKKEA